VKSEFGFEIAHVVNWLNAVPASEEGGFLSDTVWEIIFVGRISCEDRLHRKKIVR